MLGGSAVMRCDASYCGGDHVIRALLEPVEVMRDLRGRWMRMRKICWMNDIHIRLILRFITKIQEVSKNASMALHVYKLLRMASAELVTILILVVMILSMADCSRKINFLQSRLLLSLILLIFLPGVLIHCLQGLVVSRRPPFSHIQGSLFELP